MLEIPNGQITLELNGQSHQEDLGKETGNGRLECSAEENKKKTKKENING
jgi:hypothetical protein